MSFAREWREKRERFKPRGAVVIGRELRKLGVDNAIIQEALSDFDASSNAYQAGSKYAGKLPLDDKSVFKRKLGGFLHRRGFNGEVLGLTVERIWRELLDPLNRHVQGDGQHD
jgi:SOS response regulatory protein OraA/RecX